MEDAYGALPEIPQKVATSSDEPRIQRTDPPHGGQTEEFDETLYDQIGQEIETGRTVRATWTRAYAEADGDEKRTRAIYIRIRIARLRADLAENARHQADSNDRFRQYGMTDEQIEHLGAPILALHYLTKYRVTAKAVQEAIALGKIRSVICGDVLWVQDKPIK